MAIGGLRYGVRECFVTFLFFLAMPASAGFTKLFRTGDSVVSFTETCAVVSESSAPSAVPIGRPCGDQSVPDLLRQRLPISEDEDADVAWSGIFSTAGSTMTVRQVGDRDLSIGINGTEVLRFRDPHGVAEPISAAFWHDEHWVVEYLGNSVVVDGRQVGSDQSYDGVFFYRYIAGRPFYFFAKHGKVGISYDGVEQRTEYDEVAHRLCCDPAMFNPARSEDAVSFFARRGNTWFRVVARPKTEFSQMVRPGDKGTIKAVTDAEKWLNPWIRIHARTVDIEIRSPAADRRTMTVATNDLSAELAKLPMGAWPWGRLVAVSMSGPQGVNDEPQAQKAKARESVEHTLTALDIVINWWP